MSQPADEVSRRMTPPSRGRRQMAPWYEKATVSPWGEICGVNAPSARSDGVATDFGRDRAENPRSTRLERTNRAKAAALGWRMPLAPIISCEKERGFDDAIGQSTRRARTRRLPHPPHPVSKSPSESGARLTPGRFFGPVFGLG